MLAETFGFLLMFSGFEKTFKMQAMQVLSMPQWHPRLPRCIWHSQGSPAARCWESWGLCIVYGYSDPPKYSTWYLLTHLRTENTWSHVGAVYLGTWKCRGYVTQRPVSCPCCPDPPTANIEDSEVVAIRYPETRSRYGTPLLFVQGAPELLC